jgi:hypothetical protein
MYLKFNEPKDFLDYLKRQNATTVYAGITNTATEPSGQFQISSISYHAALTARFGDYIATCWLFLTRTDSATLSVPAEMQEVRRAMFTAFDKAQQNLRDQGFQVERGTWSTEPPFFLK